MLAWAMLAVLTIIELVLGYSILKLDRRARKTESGAL